MLLSDMLQLPVTLLNVLFMCLKLREKLIKLMYLWHLINK